ncbi:fimbrial protein [Pseudomonas mosselii]|uniref:Fimbrial-type adhesion domain-containing protein n=1 Tax=Pseudomonas mosselii TaxID=78327 RepID=A0AA42RTM1_9PSED|nr:fimbrial protein [Pseudomonas mosselii]MDH1629566.1 hypothetical protein [Pseudomonas mosselii]
MWVKLLLFTCFVVMAPKAFSACFFVSGASKPLAGVDLKFQSVSDSSAMISTVWHESAQSGVVKCSGAAGGKSEQIRMTNSRIYKGTYMFEGEAYGLLPTNRDDVAVIFSVITPGGITVPLNGASGIVLFEFKPDGGEVTIGYTIRYRLVALKKIAPGVTWFSMDYLVSTVLPNGTAAYYSLPSSKLSVNNASCQLRVPSSVKLQPVSVAQFPSNGSALEAARFNVVANCPPAFFGFEVLYGMTDVNAPENIADKLTNAAVTGAAKGIQLQLMDEGFPIIFAPEGVTIRATRLGSMDAAGGFLVKQLQARYIRTGSVLKAGLIKSSASIVLSYN